MFKLFFILTFFSTLSASEQFCPSESMPIEYISPTTKLKKVTCGYLKDGSLVKHGDETSYDMTGIPLKKETFHHGVKLAQAQNLPGAEEVVQKLDTDTPLKVVEQLVKILSFEKGGINSGTFHIHKCDPQLKTWVKAALTKESISKTYNFGEGCDVAGSFKASFLEVFPVVFDVRNLNDFKRTKMMVKMKIMQSANGIRYGFEVTEGMITNGSKTIVFEVQYEVDIDPLTGSSKHSTQVGKITLKKIDNRPVSISRPLIFGQ
jgi:hypothetical protein